MLKSVYIDKAIDLLRRAVVDDGILASTENLENYHRVWSRDSIIAGIAGILCEDSTVIEGLRRSLVSLRSYQSPTGAIPSNVYPPDNKVSYGGLVGRVDATTWYVIGSCLYYRETGDEEFWEEQLPSVFQSLSVLEAWEFNGKHLIYSPLSANWADEYPLHGYLLYDNILRYWGIALLANIFEDESIQTKADLIKATITSNFWPEAQDQYTYHPKNYESNVEAHQDAYFLAGFHPGGTFEMFDAAGNALALLLGFYDNEKAQAHKVYVKSIFAQLDKSLIPAFWPPIYHEDKLYDDIRNNYSYEFKNHPHHFHNGGVWPVMMGLWVMGMNSQQKDNFTAPVQNEWHHLLEADQFQFHEYISSDKFDSLGKSNLCFSAAGTIFMSCDTNDIYKILP